MSREIKFRVWDATGDRWMDIYEINLLDNDYLNNTEYPIQQFTGVLDINSKEIYEGDLVKISVDSSGSIREVKWDSVELKWGLKYPSFDTFSENLSNYKGNIEVVGNEFENKDLLNGRMPVKN